jgi:hypothetical protein
MRAFTIQDHSGIQERMRAVFETVKAALIGGPVEIIVQRPSKSREQERLYHALIGDISRTVEISGREYDAEVWKALLVDSFTQEMQIQGTPLYHPGRVVPSLDGMRAITVRASTRRFRKQEAADFIEYLYSFGAEHGAAFSDPTMRYYEEISEGVAA